MEDLGIIEKIPVGTPTPWCNSLHLVLKKNRSPEVDVRITIDPKDLNKAFQWEYHPINTIEKVITRFNGSKFFTALDANMGYLQLELDIESSLLTAFYTPFGGTNTEEYQ